MLPETAKSAQIQERQYIINIKGEYMLPMLIASIPAAINIATGVFIGATAGTVVGEAISDAISND